MPSSYLMPDAQRPFRVRCRRRDNWEEKAGQKMKQKGGERRSNDSKREHSSPARIRGASSAMIATVHLVTPQPLRSQEVAS